MSVVSVVCSQVEVCDGTITRPEKSYRLYIGDKTDTTRLDRLRTKK